MLTVDLAEKYFGSVENALGKTLRYSDTGFGFDLQVTGVFEKPDFQLQVDVEVLISYSTREQQEDPEFFVNDWGGNSFMTFIKLNDQADPATD